MIRAVYVLVLVALGIWPAAAQTKSEWYKSLRVPGTGGSCCSEADCRPVKSEYRKDGHWWALVPFDKAEKWLQVPPEKILKYPTKTADDEGRAVICTSGGSTDGYNQYVPGGDGAHWVAPYDPYIYCFVPPDMGV